MKKKKEKTSSAEVFFFNICQTSWEGINEWMSKKKKQDRLPVKTVKHDD